MENTFNGGRYEILYFFQPWGYIHTFNLQVTIIHSDNERNENEEMEASDCEGYQVSGVEEYKQLAILTGGTFVEINKFDVDDVLGIMNEGVQENEVRRMEARCGHVVKRTIKLLFNQKVLIISKVKSRIKLQSILKETMGF